MCVVVRVALQRVRVVQPTEIGNQINHKYYFLLRPSRSLSPALPLSHSLSVLPASLFMCQYEVSSSSFSSSLPVGQDIPLPSSPLLGTCFPFLDTRSIMFSVHVSGIISFHFLKSPLHVLPVRLSVCLSACCASLSLSLALSLPLLALHHCLRMAKITKQKQISNRV